MLFRRIGNMCVLLGGFISAIASQVHAGELCSAAQIVSLQANVSSGPFATEKGGEPQDLCLLNPTPEKVTNVIQQIRSLHAQVAAFLQISPSQLLPHGIHIVLEGNPLGGLDSYANTDSVHFGVFDDWSGELIDSSAYVHELTHVLVSAEQPLPQFMQKAEFTNLYHEQFPDFMALAVTGKTFDEPGLPACFSEGTRGLGPARTYLAAYGDFDIGRELRVWDGCCVEARGEIHGESMSPHLEKLCQSVESNAKDVMVLAPAEKKPFNPQRCGDQLGIWGSTESCSIHQLGTPINSFLLELKSALGRSDFMFYWEALTRAAGTPDSQLQFSCSAGGSKLTVEEPNPSAAFDILRANLGVQEEAIFKVLWKKYGMDIGMEFGRLDATRAARQMVADQLHVNTVDCRLFDPFLESPKTLSTELVQGSGKMTFTSYEKFPLQVMAPSLSETRAAIAEAGSSQQCHAMLTHYDGILSDQMKSADGFRQKLIAFAQWLSSHGVPELQDSYEEGNPVRIDLVPFCTNKVVPSGRFQWNESSDAAKSISVQLPLEPTPPAFEDEYVVFFHEMGHFVLQRMIEESNHGILSEDETTEFFPALAEGFADFVSYEFVGTPKTWIPPMRPALSSSPEDRQKVRDGTFPWFSAEAHEASQPFRDVLIEIAQAKGARASFDVTRDLVATILAARTASRKDATEHLLQLTNQAVSQAVKKIGP